jgi:hypothetical protein
MVNTLYENRESSIEIRDARYEMRDTNTENKPNFAAARMNLSSFKTMNYEQITVNNANENKPYQTQSYPKRTRSEAEIPTGELLEIRKPGTNPDQTNPPPADSPPPADPDCREIDRLMPMISVRHGAFPVTITVLPKRTYKWHRY